MGKLAQIRKSIAGHLTKPIVTLLVRTHVKPNTVTWIALFLTIIAGALIATERLIYAGLIVLVAGFCDMLDGALARLTNQVTPFGGVLDSTLDRLADSALLLGIMVLYGEKQSMTGVLIAGIAMVSSLTVSYVRARVEAIGIECKVGLFTRSERIIILALGLFVGYVNYSILTLALTIIAVFSFYTVFERLIYAWRHTRKPALSRK